MSVLKLYYYSKAVKHFTTAIKMIDEAENPTKVELDARNLAIQHLLDMSQTIEKQIEDSGLLVSENPNDIMKNWIN